jgi:hypothetical protein
MRYTANVKYVSRISLLCTILIAVFIGLWVAQQQHYSRMLRLLSSPAITDQLAGIDLAKNESFDTLLPLLSSIIDDQNDASIAAQHALVVKAFSEQRLQELHSVAIDSQLLEAAYWWNTNPTPQRKSNVELNGSFIPSINYLAWYMGFEKPPPHETMVNMTIRDRDGSTFLAALAIKKFSTKEQLNTLLSKWIHDYDLDRNCAAVLFAVLLDELPTFPHTQDDYLATMQTVCTTKDYILAWRALHNKDGTINPDMALLGMAINQEKFFPILTKSAKENKWKHPEHPILLATHFAEEIASKIPNDLLQNEETRAKWWSLFACGLLLEGR